MLAPFCWYCDQISIYKWSRRSWQTSERARCVANQEKPCRILKGPVGRARQGSDTGEGIFRLLVGSFGRQAKITYTVRGFSVQRCNHHRSLLAASSAAPVRHVAFILRIAGVPKRGCCTGSASGFLSGLTWKQEEVALGDLPTCWLAFFLGTWPRKILH